MNIELINMYRGRFSRSSRISPRKRTVFYQQKQRKFSDTVLDTLDDQFSSSIQKIIQRAAILMFQQKWEALVECCNAGLQLYEDPDLYNMKGRAVGKLGHLEQKIQLTKKAIELDSKCPTYFCNLGSAYYKLQKYEYALENHKISLQLQPQNSINYHNIGAVLYRLKRFNQAISYFKKSIQINKYQAQSYRWLGNCYKQVGQLKNALECYYTAYDLSQKDIDKIEIERLEKYLHPWRVFFTHLLLC